MDSGRSVSTGEPYLLSLATGCAACRGRACIGRFITAATIGSVTTTRQATGASVVASLAADAAIGVKLIAAGVRLSRARAQAPRHAGRAWLAIGSMSSWAATSGDHS